MSTTRSPIGYHGTSTKYVGRWQDVRSSGVSAWKVVLDSTLHCLRSVAWIGSRSRPLLVRELAKGAPTLERALGMPLRTYRVASRVDPSPVPPGQVRQSLDAFEKGMGIVLRNAWTHIEALQTTDIPLLVHYVTGVGIDNLKEGCVRAGWGGGGGGMDRGEEWTQETTA